MIIWVVIIGLILFGLGLIIVEVIFVPGTTIVGILGIILAGFGVYLSFTNFGNNVGTIVLVGTGIIATLALVISFRKGVWKKFALKDQISSKFNEHIEISTQEGDEGVALSSLRPFGKAEIKERVFEVKTNGNYVDAGEKIKVIKIDKNKIIVEPIKLEE